MGARRGGLMGKNASEEALVDMVCEGVKDARGPVVQFPFLAPDQQAGFLQDLPRQVAKQLSSLENVLAGGPGLGFLPLGLSAADVLLTELSHELLQLRPDILQPYPRVQALHDRT